MKLNFSVWSSVALYVMVKIGDQQKTVVNFPLAKIEQFLFVCLFAFLVQCYSVCNGKEW